MKLEIKHLAPYLPYRLKVNVSNNVNFEHNLILNEHNIGNVINSITIGHIVKPVLRSLSDLTKEIEHDGHMFVPIKYLFELSGMLDYIMIPDDDYATDSKFHVDDDSSYNFIFIYEDVEHCFGYLKNNPSFSLYIDDVPDDVYNQLILFEALFEMHFDVFHLIDQGLAIDINTLKPIT